MPTVVINGVAMEAKLGERLLDVARRNGAHIGFVCDGNAICQTCQCRVLAGAEFLNPPNKAERAWMPERRLNDGNRLACQAALRGNGQVEVLTTVEELRGQVAGVVSPPPGTTSAEHLAALVENLAWLNIDQLALYPFNILNTIQRLGLAKFLWPFTDISRYLADGARVVTRTVGAPPAPEAMAAQRATQYEARLNRAAAALQAAREQARKPVTRP